MKILAVDDEPFILELLPLLAARVGYPNVETASSARTALETLRNTFPVFDCLVFDINMPEIDGIELCKLVRQLDGYKLTPIIILTALSDRKYVDRAFQAGATDYATKPFDLTELGARLRLANELLIARRRSDENFQSTMSSKERKTASTSLATEVKIDGVPKLVDAVTLKNYLSQLSRSGAASSQIIAIGIDRVAELQFKATPDEFEYALREIANAINAVIIANVSLMAYFGHGVFIVASNNSLTLDFEQIERDLQFFLDERGLEYDDASPMDLEVVVGSPLRPFSSAPSDIKESLERAVARVSGRSIRRQKDSSQVQS